jgi:hypothetical protein
LALNRSEEAGAPPASESLSQAEIRALAYFAIGVSSEGSNQGRDVSHDLAFAGNISKDGTLRAIGNSGYSIGTLQTDLGQHRGGEKESFRFSRDLHDDVPAELIGSYQDWARRERPDLVLSKIEEDQTFAELGRRGREMTGPDRFDIDSVTKGKLEQFLDSDAGRTYIHDRDKRQIAKLETAVFSKIADDSVYKNASIEDQVRIATVSAKLYNQWEIEGRALVKKMQNGDFSSFAEIKTNGFSGKPDYVISGRDHALAGAEVFIALRNAHPDNPLGKAWQHVMQDPLVNPTQLRSPEYFRNEAPPEVIPGARLAISSHLASLQEPSSARVPPLRQPSYVTNPNIAAEYETVKSLFLLPEEGRRFVEAVDRGESYSKVVSYKGGKTAGFFAGGDDIAVWNRDGQGHALIDGTWHEFRGADVSVVKNKDGTTDLNLVQGNSTTRLLHVDPAAPSFRDVTSRVIDGAEGQKTPAPTPTQPVPGNRVDGGDQQGGQEMRRDEQRPVNAPDRTTSLLLDNPAHPNHAMFAALLKVAHERDDKLGRPHDEKSVQLAGALTEQALARGLTTIGAAKFNGDGTKVGMTNTTDLEAPWARTAAGNVAELVNRPFAQSSEGAATLHQLLTQAQSAQTQTLAQSQPNPDDPAPKGPRLS